MSDPRPAALTVSDVRRANVSRVLRAIQADPGLTQSELAGATGLAAGAISEIIAELAGAGLISVANDPSSTGRGRPRRILHLADEQIDAIGITITRTAIEVRGVSLAGRVISAERLPLIGPPPLDRASDLLAELVAGLLGDRAASIPVVISVPGARVGVRVGSTELEWDGAVDELLTGIRALGVTRIRVGNDGSYATLAEHRLGAGRGYDDAILLLVGRGFGGSAVVAGEILRSHHAPPGFGHVPVVTDGRACPCGLRGCAEMYASVTAIAAALGEAEAYAGVPTQVYVAELERRARAGDAAVLAVLAEARHRIGELAQILIAVLDAEVLVVGGHGGPLAPWLLPEIGGLSVVTVTQGDLGGEAVILGATIAAVDELIADPYGNREE
ncbi:hypothetical protein ASD65_10150 [Microbacterium sp. Root61]|uniref:ROK family protein n=1 Tax=Microbacterium sp. Root61 TaxID=1736570 RepID=UPI0006F39E72|nr:ROK family protein [Microbacterium sp. Root61]KRA24741.1 hypothetical protein ASD65_10150 [Microbacterium sp. Root61]